MSETANETQLSLMVEQAQLSPDTASSLLATFAPLYDRADVLVREASSISVADATHIAEIKRARRVRLQLRAVRTEADKARKMAKENSLRLGRAIDSIAGKVTGWCADQESRLLEMEQIAERAEAKRRADLEASRRAILEPLIGTDVAFYQLAEMPEETFQKLHASSLAAVEAKREAERKAAEERAAAETARIREGARIREENLRLQKEAQAKAEALEEERRRHEAERLAAEAQARKERLAQEAKARVERERHEMEIVEERLRRAREQEAAAKREAIERKAREEAEKQLARQREAEERKKAEEAKARRAAEQAPDTAKLRDLATRLLNFPLPKVSSPDAKALVERVSSELGAMAGEIQNALEAG